MKSEFFDKWKARQAEKGKFSSIGAG